MPLPPSSMLNTDAPPPLPPEATRRPGLQQLAGIQQELGSEAATPQVQALEGLQEAQHGLQKLAQSLPDLAPGLMQLIAQLEQVVPEALSKPAEVGGMQVAPPPPGAQMPMQ